MARKCHRQESGTHFIFAGEQFLGEGCPGVPDSKEFRGARYFLRIKFFGWAFPTLNVRGLVQLVEMVKLTVILA